MLSVLSVGLLIVGLVLLAIGSVSALDLWSMKRLERKLSKRPPSNDF